MSPRRNRPARSGPGRPPAPLDPVRVQRGIDTVEQWGADRWWVRRIPAAAAVKIYRCPGCAQAIRPGVAHLVVWPAEPLAGGPGEADRRHWHTACWQARDRRRPSRW